MAWSLVLLGIGNIVLPPQFLAAIPVDYLLIFGGVCAVRVITRLDVLISSHHWFAISFFLLSVIPGIVGSDRSTYGMNKIITFILFMLFCAACSVILERERFAISVFRILFWLSAIASVFVMFAADLSSTGERVSIFGLNPIGIARVSGIATVVGVGLILARRYRNSGELLVLAFGSVAGLAATTVTGSRGPFIAVFLTLFVLVLIANRVGRFGLMQIGLMLIAAVGALVWLFASGRGATGRLTSGGDTGRSVFFGDALDVGFKSPIGIGWGDLPGVLTGYSNSDGILYPHNIVIEIFVEGGVVALLGFFVLAVTALRTSAVSAFDKQNHMSPLVFAFLIFTLINAQFSSDIVGNRVMWFAIALSLYIGKHHRREDAVGLSSTSVQYLAGGASANRI